MDEKPNRFINNEEKPLDDNGFSSSSNHQNIDNFDDSSNRLQNDQSNQLRPNISKNINPMMNKKNINNNLNQDKNIKQKARLDKATGGTLGSTDSNSLFRKSLSDDELESNEIGSTLNKLRHPFKSLFGKNQEVQAETNSIDVAKTSKKMIRLIPPLAGITTSLLPIIILIIIIVSLLLPLIMTVDTIKSIGKNLFERFGNFFSFNGFKTDHELQVELYERVDKVVEIYPELSKESLLGLLYYGLITPEDYLDNLSKDKVEIEENDLLDFGEMKRYTFTIANQLIYSTVVFNNDIIKEEIKEEKNGKVVVKDIKYKCAAGTEIRTTMKELCDENNVAKFTDGPGDLDYSTADYCINQVSESNTKKYENDPKFSNYKDLRCVIINYETNTDNSRQKLENFLRYVLLPDTYFDEYSFSGDGYEWDEMVSKFSTIAKSENKVSDIYNIPSHKVGTEIDYYSGLKHDEQKKIEDSIQTILAIIELAKNNKKVAEKYHIAGAASLPLDFVIREPIEDTINKRVTSPFGSQESFRSHPHRGVDFSWVTAEDPVYSMLDGVVHSTSLASSDCGIGVMIAHDTDGDGKYNYYTRYCHLSTKFVNTGDQVMNGQKIGIMGNTGNSKGRHLHFEIRLDDFNTRVDPVPFLIDIVKNNSQFTNAPKVLTQTEIQNLETKFNNLIDGNLKTRSGVVIAAKFLVDNLNTLPYYCGGYTSNLIDPNWFNEKLVTDSSCSTYNTNAKYGLDTSGFVSWALTQAGFANNGYTSNDLLELGEKIDMYDSKVKVGDLAYKGDKVGIIIELDENNAVVAYMDSTGVKATTVNRKIVKSLFSNVISMENYYKKG